MSWKFSPSLWKSICETTISTMYINRTDINNLSKIALISEIDQCLEIYTSLNQDSITKSKHKHRKLGPHIVTGLKGFFCRQRRSIALTTSPQSYEKKTKNPWDFCRSATLLPWFFRCFQPLWKNLWILCMSIIFFVARIDCRLPPPRAHWVPSLEPRVEVLAPGYQQVMYDHL